MLYIGGLAEGWKDWLLRHETDKKSRFIQPWWDGSDPQGKTILVWNEQGLGDEIIFASMLPELQAQDAKIILEANQRLVPLFARSFPDIEVIPRQTPPHPRTLDAALQVSSEGMGPFFRAGMKDFTGGKPFLRCDEAKRAALRKKYEGFGKKRIIGISWRSKAKLVGLYKSSELKEWASLLSMPDTLFVDLQYGDTAEERKSFPQLYHDPEIDQMQDMDAFAAQVAACDAIVTVSNTAAHVAGALGVPTHVMLHAARGVLWYWFKESDRSPWYASARLYRQAQGGNWQDVIERVKAAL
jgi:hypothetical protein